MSVRVHRINWRTAGWGLLRWILAGVFFYAGLMKLLDAATFSSSIARFQMVPEFLVNAIALGLPPLEIVSAVALLVGRWKRAAALSIILLCVLFLVALLSASARGIAVECSCFGSATAEPLWRIIARDIGMLGSAVAVYLHLLRQELSFRKQGEFPYSVTRQLDLR